jgi:hypothetical protein
MECSTMQDIYERRLIERFDLRVPAIIKQVANENREEFHLLLTRDISSGGAYFDAMEPVSYDGRIEVQLLYEVQNSRNHVNYVQMSTTGTVVRSDSYGLAVNFDEKATLKPFHIDQ